MFKLKEVVCAAAEPPVAIYDDLYDLLTDGIEFLPLRRDTAYTYASLSPVRSRSSAIVRRRNCDRALVRGRTRVPLAHGGKHRARHDVRQCCEAENIVKSVHTGFKAA